MNVTHQPAALPLTPAADRIRWLAWATVEADDKGMERGRVAWLFRLLFGHFPTSGESAGARRIRTGTE